MQSCSTLFCYAGVLALPLLLLSPAHAKGELKNPFACEIREALLCYGANAYEIGTMAARSVGMLIGRRSGSPCCCR